MDFAKPLVPGRLLRRYKRFLADVELADGSIVTAHLANPGSMMGLNAPGLEVWLEPNDDPKRKLKFTWRVVRLRKGGPGGAPLGERAEAWVGIDTSVPNRVVGEALRNRAVPGLEGYESVRSEVKYGSASRVDFLLTGAGLPDAYIEVKNVHLVREPGLAEFPDSVTARGAKHLGELAAMVAAGHRAVMLYCVQRDDATRLALAEDLDPAYARAWRAAEAAGVERIALGCYVSTSGILLDRTVSISA